MTAPADCTRLFACHQRIEVGHWTAEIRNDELAAIAFEGVPVLRAIRAVVRDKDWRTLVPGVRQTVQRTEGSTHVLLLDLLFEGYGCQYAGELAIRFSGETVSVTFDGVAPADFRCNRIGLVVLHWPDEAGRRVIIESPAGVSTSSYFPVDISAHQPFLEVASMGWVRDGVDFRLDFTGDLFETEDQRNWTDASYKTYGTPLAKPFPVDVAKGSRVQQSVTLSAAPTNSGGQPIAPAPGDSSDERLPLLEAEATVVPALSVGATTGPHGATVAVKPMLGLEAILVEVQVGPAAEQHVASAVSQAAMLGVQLDVRLVVQCVEQISELLALLPLQRVIRLAAFDAASHVTEPPLWNALKAEAGRHGFAGSLVASVRSHFTELNPNTERLPLDATSLTYSITPQMHATEVPHIVESLPIQGLTAVNALRISDGRPIHVGPITLKARFNAVATSAVGDEPQLTPETDELQDDPFAAAWLLGSIAALSLEGVDSVSYFEVSGPRGITGPEGFTPAGELLALLASFRGKPVLRYKGGQAGLVLYPVRTDDGVVIFAANLTMHAIRTGLEMPNGGTADLALEPWTWSVHRAERE